MNVATKSTLMRAIGTYTVSNITVAAIPFLLLPILTRVLTPQDYGIVAMFGITVSAFSALTGLGTLGAVEVRFFELEKGALATYVSGCLIVLLGSSLLLAAITWTTSSFLSAATSVPPEWLLACVAVSAMQFVVLLRLSLWQAENRPSRYAGLQIAQSALNAVLSLAFVLILHLAWRGRTWGICFSSVVICVVALVSLYRDGWISHHPTRDQIRDALRFGMPLVPHAIGALLIATMDRVMITNLLDVTQTGIYAVALQIGMVVSIVTGASNKAFAPWLFRQLREQTSEMQIRIVRLTYAYFAALIVLAMAVGFGAPPLLAVLVGESFRAASGVVIYIALGYALGGMYFMVTNYVFWLGATGRLSLITITSGVVNLACSYWLIGVWGLEGAGFGFMLSQGLLFLGAWVLAQNVHPMPWVSAVIQRRQRKA